MRNYLLVAIKSIVACTSLGLVLTVHAQMATPPAMSSKASSPATPGAPAVVYTGAAIKSAQATPPQPVDSIAVVVNDEVITRGELADRMVAVQKRLTVQGIPLPPSTQLQRQLLEQMIVERAELQMAKQNGIIVDDAMLDMAVSRIAEQNKLSMPMFREQLEHDGIAYSSFREDIRREIILQRLKEREVDNKVRVSESEVDNYLAAQNNANVQHEELNLSQILIKVPENATQQQLEQSRQRAEDVLNQLRSGRDFAETAATYSDSGDALSGGNLGWRTTDRLPQLFLNAVASLKPGEITGILKSGNGFHILKLVDRRADNTQAAAPAVEQTHVRHILIKVNQVVSAAEARRKLLDLKERLDNKSATFEELAKLYSNDLSASNGGDLGWVYPGDTVTEFERAMNQLKVGEVSEPIETPFGFHLIQVVERKTDDVSQERIRQAARQAIRARKIDEETEDWLRQLRDRTYVEYRDDN